MLFCSLYGIFCFMFYIFIFIIKMGENGVKISEVYVCLGDIYNFWVKFRCWIKLNSKIKRGGFWLVIVF